MDDDAQRKLVNNERLKLLATFVNGTAIALFAVGGWRQYLRILPDRSGSPSLPRYQAAFAWQEHVAYII